MAGHEARDTARETFKEDFFRVGDDEEDEVPRAQLRSRGQKSIEEPREDDFLSHPSMAPCVIWHTPMRVKIAANLPHDLRNVVDADDAFVKDERVLPDIWDDKFLPVTRSSVKAPMPIDCPRYRQANYGAWYLPVKDWKDAKSDGAKGGGGKGAGKRRGGEEDEDVASLLEKMDKEIVKLSSSRMFYQYIKSQGWRVPHYLRRMDHDAQTAD
eukprot:CAMPEP_0180330074 /NCGR_PEP_ID=MMETSP0988-20121125/41128_1 /TAXON_ID=697907 /ORGANISM="non described non described, Strain CCMP2293" /LENGTH=211 /DNA_ID=CAMNT_0022317275 /DNA_START=27 /DNA_END=659 /DNA_ORIENTATION=+